MPRLSKGPVAASDPAIWISLLYLLDIARMECHVARRQIEPNPKHEVQGCRCILQCFLAASDATGDVNRRGNSVFDISQKLFLSDKSRPGL